MLTSCVLAFLFQVPKHGTHAPLVPIILHFWIITTKKKEIEAAYAKRPVFPCALSILENIHFADFHLVFPGSFVRHPFYQFLKRKGK